MNLVLIALLLVIARPLHLNASTGFLRNTAKASFELNTFVPIETNRLVLRKIVLDDALAIFEILSDKRVVSSTAGLEQYTSTDQAKELVNEIVHNYQSGYDPLIFAIIDKSSDNLIGCVGFFGYNALFSRAELGYFLSPHSWGKGFVTEAAQALVNFGFTNMHLNRIEATVFPENSASIRVLEKIGMQCEGLMRQHVMRDGKFRDRKLYAILRDEWQGYQR